MTIAIVATLLASIALAEDFKTINGKEYKNVEVGRVEPDGLVLWSKSAIVKVYFSELPKEVVDKWLPPEDKERIAAEKTAEEKHIEAQRAADRDRAEKEKNAEADLKRALEQFQAAEQHASQAYQSAPKGTVIGQVLVSSRGGENFKLGAVQVGLFARDAVDSLLAELRKYADYKIQQLSASVSERSTTKDQAEANRKAASEAVTQAILAGRDYTAEERASDLAITTAATASEEYEDMKQRLDFCYSGGFYLAFLQSPIRTVETDADGKFVIELPRTGAFAIAAKAERSVMQYTEHYYWLQPVSLEGQQQLTQNLSNNNLTSTTGTSALILTKD